MNKSLNAEIHDKFNRLFFYNLMYSINSTSYCAVEAASNESPIGNLTLYLSDFARV